MEAIIFAFVAVSGWLVALSLAVRGLSLDVAELERNQARLLKASVQMSNNVNELANAFLARPRKS